jgi:hypothetical protein
VAVCAIKWCFCHSERTELVKQPHGFSLTLTAYSTLAIQEQSGSR